MIIMTESKHDCHSVCFTKIGPWINYLVNLIYLQYQQKKWSRTQALDLETVLRRSTQTQPQRGQKHALIMPRMIMYMPDRLEFIKTMIKSTSTWCAFHTNMKTLASDDVFEEQKTRADGDNREASAGNIGSVRVIPLQFQSSCVSVSREKQLPLTLPRIQVFQRHFIAELVLILQKEKIIIRTHLIISHTIQLVSTPLNILNVCYYSSIDILL